jgi:AcrR family transcriptional regulator
LTRGLSGLKVLTVLDLPKRDRHAERREATRREILDAAWRLAQREGLTQLTLRDVAAAVGMRAPSLYSHFESKNAIYDAMFGQAWSEYEDSLAALEPNLADHPRTAVKQLARHFFDYATAELPRHQLMNQRIIPGFEPTPDAYAPSVRVLEHAVENLRRRGVTSRDDVDIWVALVGGLVNQHHANDPGGTRYAVLLDQAMDMWADAVGLPPHTAGERRKAHR